MELVCPKCGKVGRSASLIPAGKVVRCPACKETFSVAAPAPESGPVGLPIVIDQSSTEDSLPNPPIERPFASNNERTPVDPRNEQPILATGQAWDDLDDSLPFAPSSSQTEDQDAPATRYSKTGPTAKTRNPAEDLQNNSKFNSTPSERSMSPNVGGQGLDWPQVATAETDLFGKALSQEIRTSEQFWSIFIRVLTDPRKTFSQALDEPGMLSYSIAMIAATAMLYASIWLPAIFNMGRALDQSGRDIKFIGGNNFGAPRGFPGAQIPEATRQSPGLLSRLLNEVPGPILAASMALTAVWLLGSGAIALISTNPKSRAIRRGITALGLSLTPLVCSLFAAFLLLFLGAAEISTGLIAYGALVWLLLYHDALQVIADIPPNRVYFVGPFIVAGGLYILGRFSGPKIISLLIGFLSP